MTDPLESPTLRAGNLYAEVDDRGDGTRRVVQAPYEFSDAEAGVRGSAPRRGEHNANVLADWLSLEEAQIRELAEAGVLLAE